MKLSETQRKALKHFRRYPQTSAIAAGATLGTMKALARRKLIYVATTFDNIAYPRQALAEITDAGRAVLGRSDSHGASIRRYR